MARGTKNKLMKDGIVPVRRISLHQFKWVHALPQLNGELSKYTLRIYLCAERDSSI